MICASVASVRPYVGNKEERTGRKKAAKEESEKIKEFKKKEKNEKVDHLGLIGSFIESVESSFFSHHFKMYGVDYPPYHGPIFSTIPPSTHHHHHEWKYGLYVGIAFATILIGESQSRHIGAIGSDHFDLS